MSRTGSATTRAAASRSRTAVSGMSVSTATLAGSAVSARALSADATMRKLSSGRRAATVLRSSKSRRGSAPTESTSISGVTAVFGRNAFVSTPKGTNTTGGAPSPSQSRSHCTSLSAYDTSARAQQRVADAGVARVDDRHPHNARPAEQHQGKPDGVDGREHDVRAVDRPQRRQDRGEVAAVAADSVDECVERRARGPGPAGRRGVALEVVTDTGAASDLVEPEQPIALRRSGAGGQRRSPLGRVAQGEEDAHRHGDILSCKCQATARGR